MTDDLKQKLSPLAWQVTQEKATENPFSGEYNDFDQPGKYFCICCDKHLFNSEHKFESGCGWPAFHKAQSDSTREEIDNSHNMTRIDPWYTLLYQFSFYEVSTNGLLIPIKNSFKVSQYLAIYHYL